MNNFSHEAEQSVIAACILSEKAYDICAGMLTPEDFALINHKLLYRAVVELRENGKGVDIVTVNNQLQRVDVANEQAFQSTDESLAYISGIADLIPTTRHTREYAEVVKDHAISRQLKVVAGEISDIADQALPATEKTSLANAALEKINPETGGQEAKSIRAVMLEAIGVLEQRMSTTGLISGLSTGFEEIDRITNGLQKADLFVLAGRPSMGKSTLAMNIAENVARSKPVLVFSLEMSASALGERLIASCGNIEFKGLRSGILEKRAQDDMGSAILQLRDTKLAIDDSAGLSIDQLRSRARIHARKHGCGLIVVDYLQLLTGVGENKTNEIGYISRGLKALAKELNVPVLALSQLNRALANRKDKRPELSDLRGSGDIEQDADVIAFIHLEQKYDPDTHLLGLAELIFAKQRQEETGTVYLKEDLRHMRYLTNFDPVPEAPQKNGKKPYAKISAFGLGDELRHF